MKQPLLEIGDSQLRLLTIHIEINAQNDNQSRPHVLHHERLAEEDE